MYICIYIVYKCWITECSIGRYRHSLQMLRWRRDSCLGQIHVWYRILLSSATWNFKLRCCLFLKFIYHKLSWLLATETTNKRTSFFCVYWVSHWGVQAGRISPTWELSEGSTHCSLPQRSSPWGFADPLFLNNLHIQESASQKKYWCQEPARWTRACINFGDQIVGGSKSHSGALLPLKHLRPALFSVNYLCTPIHKGRTDRKYQKNRRAAACYCLFSLFPLAFSLPFLPHLSSPLVKSQADCQLRRPSFSTASCMDGVLLEQAI